ncbi:MAG: AarF/UbiB family protein, partial [Candidatus Thioglobus sp.]
FKTFDDAPLASASIAQVHTATTLEGNKVVVKVVRPDIDALIGGDIRLMHSLAKLINNHPMAKKIRPIEIVEEFESIINDELDMRIEAGHCDKLRENFKASDLLYVPKVFHQLSGIRVLTTERIYGTPIGEIETLKAKNIDMKRLAEEGVIIFFTQVFKHNFFHADMHPGNIFVSDEGQYIGVDFGIMGTLSEEDKDFLADIFLAFFNQDYRKVARVYIDSGWVGANTDEKAFEAAVKKICDPMFDRPLGEISFGQVLLDLIQEAKNFDITVQPQLLLLDKTLLNIEGLGRQLYPQLDLWSTAKPFLEDLMKERYSMKNTFEKLKKEAPELLKEIPELPSLFINALKQLGKMKDINKLYAQQTNQIVDQLKDNANKQTSAIFAGSLLILSGVFAVNNSWIAGTISATIALIFWMKSR